MLSYDAHMPDSMEVKDSQKTIPEAQHVEQVASTPDSNAVYNPDEEPEIHARTWFALAAMFILNLVQVFGLLGPPAGLAYIEKDLDNSLAGTWVPNALSLVQAVLAPLVASISDTFQARKIILVGTSTISFIGSAIAPTSNSIYRVIAAQVLVGFGFAAVPLAYCVPSEILPRKWRPMAQSGINLAAAAGACSGPLIIGSLTKADPHTGWRYFYWIQMALWGTTSLGLLVGYQPPKRHTQLDHLSFWGKISRLDLPGFFLLTAGLALLLTGLNLGGGLYGWASAEVLATLVVGIITLVAFGIYEWRFTKTGILHHELFQGGGNRGRTFAICVGLIFVEGILLFSYIIFYPVVVSNLFETDPFLQSVRQMPFWIASATSTILYGYWSSRCRTIRAPTAVGFLIFTSGVVGLATIQPDDSVRAWIFAGLAGVGFGAPLILIISGVQLSTPHHLIATATAATTCSRAVAASAFTAIYTAAMDDRMAQYIPSYITKEAVRRGLPSASLEAFIQAISTNNTADLDDIPGVTASIVQAGYRALKHAQADALRIVYIIAAPFGIVACIACFFLGDMKSAMTYEIDAPIEEIHRKRGNDDKKAGLDYRV